MNRALKYRIYPTKEQTILFAKTFGCCRKVWNLMLADKKAYYEKNHKTLSVTPAQYKNDYPYLREVDSLSLANAQLNLEAAYKNCYKDKNTKPPKFKSKHKSRKSYTTNCLYPKKGKPTIRIGDGVIHLPVVGDVKAVIHREADPEWKLKSAAISMDSCGDYYISVLYEYDAVVVASVPDISNVVGFDYKSDGLYVSSDGSSADMPHYYRKSQRKLAKAQRILSRRKGSRKGEKKSSNWIKQHNKVNKIHRKTANQRKDFLHKQSTGIANRYDAVCIEDLNVKAMSNKGFGNGKATMDNGWGMFTCMLDYKLADRGKPLIKIDKWFPSSQLCHHCGYRNTAVKDLGLRKITCPSCGSTYDRDTNAAMNIRDEGLRALAVA